MNDETIQAIVRIAAANRPDEEIIDYAQVRIMNIIGIAVDIDTNKFIKVDTSGRDGVVMSIYDGVYILSFKCKIINGNVHVKIIEFINDIINKKTEATYLLSDEGEIMDHIYHLTKNCINLKD